MKVADALSRKEGNSLLWFVYADDEVGLLALSGAEWRVWDRIKEAMQFDARTVEIRKKLEDHEETPYEVVATIIDTRESLGGPDLDFAEGLLSSGGYESIMVVVDRLSKGAHFIPLKHYFTSSSVAKAFVDNVVKLKGIPRSIVTDRGKLFMSSFWQELFTLQGSKLKASSSYHPQTDR
ncbi:hypothetical protein LWI28_014479 [Acer negundo]|uniref:Integrase catalytic domain-containing protein n=1 Tax=Acer negundo TaxID=4023 RepID=A0AAD5JWN3_ACENE|nr:hypothetical protein LWI28_014479 [Acer negundo]